MNTDKRKLADKLREFICRGEKIGETEKHPAERGFIISYIAGPSYDQWMDEINMFNERYLGGHPLYEQIHTTYFFKKKPSAYTDMMGHLRALLTDDELVGESDKEKDGFPIAKILQEDVGRCEVYDKRAKEEREMRNKVFIVHGHDEAAKLEMARTLEKGGFDAVILHEQSDSGLTIIEKLERYVNESCFSVVLYTGCDQGRAKEMSVGDERPRARQNVVFEHGYLIGKLGRNRVCALVKGDVETPGDISGVVYIPMDQAGAWKMKLAQNMKDCGLAVDLNLFLA